MTLLAMRFLFIIIVGILCVLSPSLGIMQAPSIKTLNNVHLIFDLGGVCVDTHYVKSLKYLGLGNVMTHTLWHFKKPSTIKKRLYAILDQIQPDGNNENILDYDQDVLPGLMCDWMINKITNKELRSLVLTNIHAHPEWFMNKTEQILTYNLAHMMFTPEFFVDTRIISVNSANFIAQCKQSGFRLSVLSNWDTESFTLLSEKHSVFFNQFDSIRISGDNGYLKPHENAYRWFIEKYPEDIFIFIDDQPENIIAAEKVGMLGILYIKNDCLTVDKIYERIHAAINVSNG